MSYHPGQRPSGLRWRDDTGIELRCESCPPSMRWWPLTREFWDFEHTFRRCRACRDKSKHASQRRRMNESPALREKAREYQRKYRAESKEVKSLKQRIRYWDDPERARQQSLDYYYRNREVVLERRRQRHAERKAA